MFTNISRFTAATKESAKEKEDEELLCEIQGQDLIAKEAPVPCLLQKGIQQEIREECFEK